MKNNIRYFRWHAGVGMAGVGIPFIIVSDEWELSFYHDGDPVEILYQTPYEDRLRMNWREISRIEFMTMWEGFFKNG